MRCSAHLARVIVAWAVLGIASVTGDPDSGPCWPVPLFVVRVRETGGVLAGAVMPFAYSPECREMVLVQVRAGRGAGELTGELEVSESTIHRWVSQDQIDRGTRPGTTIAEGAELRAAHR